MAGCQWALLPSCYGSKSTVHEHFQRWVSAVVFAEMFSLGAAKYEELEGFKWDLQSMDGSLVQTPTRQSRNLSEEGIGRNPTDRGKSGSKIHLLVDQEGMPCGVALAGANVHDSRLVAATVEGCALCAPKINPEEKPHLCLDKAYDMKRVETEVLNLGYTPHIRRIGEEKQHGPLDIHPARRWVVERTLVVEHSAETTRFVCTLATVLWYEIDWIGRAV